MLAHHHASIVHFVPGHMLHEAVAALAVVVDQMGRVLGCVERQLARPVFARDILDVLDELAADARALQRGFNRELPEVRDVVAVVPEAAEVRSGRLIGDRADNTAIEFSDEAAVFDPMARGLLRLMRGYEVQAHIRQRLVRAVEQIGEMGD